MHEDETTREVLAWIAKAEQDLKTIDYVFPHADAPLDIVCFHAQQAAEKYIKALLTFYAVPFRKTHDLAELILTLPADSAVPARVGDLADLSDAGVSSRYPDDLVRYDRALTQRLFEQALGVKAAVMAELESQSSASGLGLPPTKA